MVNLKTKRLLLNTLKPLLLCYAIVCILLYFFQEKLIFLPDKLHQDFKFSFRQPFREIHIRTNDNTLLNGLLFTTDSSKGLIFYLHGNAGSLHNWGHVAKRYTDLGYDVFLLDYRGYGKSGGAIKSEAQLAEDVQTAYNELRKSYEEGKIIILGYSIGTGPAAKLAADNQPKLLILQAPFYNLADMMKNYYPVIPVFLLRYKFNTNENLRKCSMPVVIFHGDHDEVIDYSSSLKLKTLMKSGDTLITLEGQKHNGITDNQQYIQVLPQLLPGP